MPPQQTSMPASLRSPKPPSTPRRDRREGSSPTGTGYFGLAVDGSNAVSSSGARMAKISLSSSGVSIRSAAASPPQSLPFHSTPDFDAFRHAAERSSFSLNQASVPKTAVPSEQRKGRPSLDRKSSSQPSSSPKVKTPGPASHKIDLSATSDISNTLRSPNKRLLSNDSGGILDQPRRESPAPFTEENDIRHTASLPSKHDEKHHRLENTKVPSGLANHRGETLPEKFDTGSPCLVTSQYIVNILESHGEEVLLLDLRVSTQYTRSRISGALNLCIPTTLLKRPTYSVSRLTDTFRDEAQKSKFDNWRNCQCIIVYDGSSSQLKEATNCSNILKKFISEGWQGNSYIVRGGFSEFSRRFPQLLDHGDFGNNHSSAVAPALKTANETVAPVIGGCPMPASATKTAANPFFGNIRQNMDLIGGVGQMQIKVPSTASKQQRSNFPLWLRNATDEADDGKSVSDKFYYIEKCEQKRMQEALSGKVVYGTNSSESTKSVHIAGIEKGAKNRYNNIWPFEHTRVKLQGVPSHDCDYINANFVQSSLSNKKYIATQGPIPETFNDFWKMVWQRDIRVIVMLTAETEGGQVKAHNYWSNKSYGSFRVRYLSEHRASLELSRIRSHRERPSLGGRRSSHGPSSVSIGADSRNAPGVKRSEETENLDRPSPMSADSPFVHVRKLTLSHESEPFERMREITHLQYSSWPDFGAPAHPAHLLALIEQCDAVVRANTSTTKMDAAPSDQRPVLVHCSAGCGRTGTFCTVDSVIDMLKKQKNYERNKQRALMQQQQRMNAKQLSSREFDPTLPVVSFNEASMGAKDGLDGTWLGREDLDFVEKTVEEFRMQRLSMVQSLRQFVLCYETVLEWLMGPEVSP